MNDYKFKVYYIDIQDSDEIKSTQKELDVANAKLIPIKTRLESSISSVINVSIVLIDSNGIDLNVVG